MNPNACLQVVKTAAPAAVSMSGLQRSAHTAATKSKSKQTPVEDMAELEIVKPAAAKSPIPQPDPAALSATPEMACKVGWDRVSQGRLAWHACWRMLQTPLLLHSLSLPACRPSRRPPPSQWRLSTSPAVRSWQPPTLFCCWPTLLL